MTEGAVGARRGRSNLHARLRAAAFHGLATNPTVPPAERLALALQALDLYERQVDLLTTANEVYWQAQAALDEILGPNVEDGAGQGLVAEIRLLALQRDSANAIRRNLAARLAAVQPVIDALRELLALTPLTADYEQRKPQAWLKVRAAMKELDAADSSPEGPTT